ncbi:MAG: hypothetical protein C6I05_05460 [Epsilonproteobacteria bacterium]|nr:hypothetical protein [Nitratiruptor sp.]MRJ02880.1 hypothetical protein [Campylobacterota bacterium]NPA82973.1 hypothetical protein [Campylobacterota bacterium]
MAELSQVFDTLHKGVLVSVNSRRYSDIAQFLLVEENLEELREIVERLGYRLIAQSGYFYLTRATIDRAQKELFINQHKRVIVAVSILRDLFPLLSADMVIKQSEVIALLRKRGDLTQELAYATSQKDLLLGVNELFRLLERTFVLEQTAQDDGDSFRVLAGIHYYTTIVELIDD